MQELISLVEGHRWWKNGLRTNLSSDPDHFRVVFLPRMDDLEDSIGRIANYLDRIRKK